MSTGIRFNITARDIRQAREQNLRPLAKHCPLARALRRTYDGEVSVGANAVYLGNRAPVRMSGKVYCWVRDFDSGSIVKPLRGTL